MKSLKKFLPIVLVLSLVFSPAALATVGDTIAFSILSGSTNGRGIVVVATATAGTLIHTAAGGSTNIHRVKLYVVNTHTDVVDLTLEWGGVTDPNDLINVDNIPVESGLYKVADLPLNGGLIIRAFGSVASKLVIWGLVYEMTE